jgi:DNA-binding NarL/FixJ family response regulator
MAKYASGKRGKTERDGERRRTGGRGDTHREIKRLLIVHHNSLLAELLLDAILSNFRVDSFGVANSYEAARDLLAGGSPDFLVIEWIIDQTMATGFLRTVEGSPRANTKIVALGHDRNAAVAKDALDKGAHGYLCCRESTRQHLIDAMRSLFAGETYLSPRMVSRITGQNGSEMESASRSRLSSREREIFAHVGWGLTNKRIAEALGVSIRTIESHKENLKNKLDVASNIELGRMAAVWLDKGSI